MRPSSRASTPSYAKVGVNIAVHKRKLYSSSGVYATSLLSLQGRDALFERISPTSDIWGKTKRRISHWE